MEAELLAAAKCSIVRLPNMEVKCYIPTRVHTYHFGPWNIQEMKVQENIGMITRRLIIKTEKVRCTTDRTLHLTIAIWKAMQSKTLNAGLNSGMKDREQANALAVAA